ncbi:MAG: hypothetical protein ACE14M_03915 [Terriglobales bacterium]
MTAMLLLQTSSSDVPAILVLGGAVLAALLAYIFYLPSSVASAPEKTRLAFLRERKETVYDNLRDLNFEYKAGKYPEADYREMRTALEEEAAAILAEMETLERDATRPIFQTLLRSKGASGQKTKGARL